MNNQAQNKFLIALGLFSVLLFAFAIVYFFYIQAQLVQKPALPVPPVVLEPEKPEPPTDLPLATCGERHDMAFEICCVNNDGSIIEDCTERKEFDRGQVVRFAVRPWKFTIPSGSHNLCITTDLVDQRNAFMPEEPTCVTVNRDTHLPVFKTSNMLVPSRQGEFDLFVITVSSIDKITETSTIFRASAQAR